MNARIIKTEVMKMEKHVFVDIPYRADRKGLYRTLRVDEYSEDAYRLEQLIEEAENTARPKALYASAFIEQKADNHVVIEGIKFESRVLSVNLSKVHRCFPYVATCGTEIEGWSESITEFIERYWADEIKKQALSCALKYMNSNMNERYGLGRTSSMNPGSLKDWPIDQQKKLFGLLGGEIESTGVMLSESFLMNPVKSVSGIRFETESGYENCMLCQRQNCPGRRAPYNPELYTDRYG